MDILQINKNNLYYRIVVLIFFPFLYIEKIRLGLKLSFNYLKYPSKKWMLESNDKTDQYQNLLLLISFSMSILQSLW